MKLYRDFTSQEEIDFEYNLALRLPDMADWMDWYVRESAAARQELKCELEDPYGLTSDETVDVFPTHQSNSPVLVYIHGGYWYRGSRKDYSFVARGLVERGIMTVLEPCLWRITFN